MTALLPGLIGVWVAPAHAVTITHEVQPGETLFRIAIQYGLTQQVIRAANGIRGSLIYVGQALIIPDGTTSTVEHPITVSPTRVHVVQPGETLFRIGLRYGESWRALQVANRIPSARIYVGQSLTIPQPISSQTNAPGPTSASDNPPEPTPTPTSPVSALDPIATTIQQPAASPTNQDVINAIIVGAGNFKEELDDWMASIGLEEIYANRKVPYIGPTIGELPNLSADRKEAIAQALTLSPAKLAKAAITVSKRQATELDSALRPPIPATLREDGKWFLVDISQQRLYAYEWDVLVRETLVSTGLPRTPTITGTYGIYLRHPTARMRGPGYNLPNVPWVMYFYKGYGLHGTYWHNDFGRPRSHGCVNLSIAEASWAYHWSSYGTPVVIQQ